MQRFWYVRAAFAFCALVSIAACGGGGGSTGAISPPTGPTATPPGVSTSSVAGTAATGKALAGATVSLKDSKGATKSATTAADGSYTIDTSGMTGPFIVQTTSSAGTKLYSVSADANAKTIVNITPLTDLVARAWYGAQGANVDSAFASASPNAPPPVAATSLSGTIQNVVQLWLNKAGVSATGFSLISSPFIPNSTGVDLVLSQATVTASTGQIRITDGSTTQNTTLTYGAGTITAASTTTGPAGTTSSSTTTVVPTQTSQQTGLLAIGTLASAFANTVNTKGAGLQASDLLPFFDPGLLWDGKTASQVAADFAADIAGSTVSLTLQQIKQLDASGADLFFVISQSKAGQTRTQITELFFKPSGSTWLLSGNNQKVHFSLQAEMRTNQGASAGGNGPDVNVDVTSPKGSFSGITVSGGSLWSGAALTQGATRVEASGQYDAFFLNSGVLSPAQIPAAGTLFTLNLTGAGGPATASATLNSFTNEPMSFTSPTGTTIASANLGSALTMSWTLPQTYAIAYLQLSALSFTGPQNDPATFQCSTQGIVGNSATTATITIPATCNGLAVKNVDLNLSANGVNGERSFALYMMQ